MVYDTHAVYKQMFILVYLEIILLKYECKYLITNQKQNSIKTYTDISICKLIFCITQH